jgi:hydroxycarboxylate dehydrogenase B
MHVIPADRLRAAVRLVVAGFGSSEAEIADVTDNLVEANLTGHDSHGVGMVPRMPRPSWKAT